MDNICYYLINNCNSSNSTKELSYSTMENGYDCSIDELCNQLKNLLGVSISEITKYNENWGYQRKTIISFLYKKRKCNVCEHFDTQRDYLCLNVEPNMNIKKSYLEALMFHE